MKYNLEYIKNKYESNGFVLIRNILNKSEIDNINIQLDNYISKHILKKNKNKRKVNFTKSNKINSMHGIDDLPSINYIRKKIELKKIITSILGKEYRNFGSELFAKPAGQGMPVPIHQDNKYWCLNDGNAVTVWFALEKSNKNNGGIFYFAKSHLFGVFEHDPSYAPGSSQKLKYDKGLKLFRKQTPSLKPGDCIIHSCMVLHGSEANKSSNSRKGLTLRFKSKKSKIDKKLQIYYEEELKKQIKMRI